MYICIYISQYASIKVQICIHIELYLYSYLCRLIMAHARQLQLQGTYLADGPYSAHWGVCNTPQCIYVLVAGGWCEACWAAHVAWHGRPYFMPPEFQLHEAIRSRARLILEIARLRGTPLDSFFYILLLSYFYQDPASPTLSENHDPSEP